jgi:Na+-translocating ferredoxin:NAD+ oxidoreductase RnfD subunit
MSARLSKLTTVYLPKPLRTPKGLLILVFLLLLPFAVLQENAGQSLRTWLLATLTAGLIDLVILRLRWGTLVLPDGALLTGMIVGFVLRPHEEPWVVIVTAALAVGSKYVLRTKWSNVFNPAALALFISAIAFESGESWWGALPQAGYPGIALLLATGAFITDRINKAPMVLVFLGLYFLLFTIAALLGDTQEYRDPFRAPTLQAALFFAFFMLDDPPTSPVRYGHQVVFAAIATVGAVAVYVANGALYFLLAGLLLANAWESARRLLVPMWRARSQDGRDLTAIP